MKSSLDPGNVVIDQLVADREAFIKFVYTPLSDIEAEYKKRWEDVDLITKVDSYLEGDIPLPFIKGYRGVLFRQLFSPNYEFRRFIHLVKEIGFQPIYMEYLTDKFTSINPLKHCLGKIRCQELPGSNIKSQVKSNTIIDFNESQGMQICEVQTVWHQSLVEFHHELLVSEFSNSNEYLFDASNWFHKKGGCAKQYYSRYTALFIRNGVLFENFTLEGDELQFTKTIFLPAFIEVWNATGKKPLIVALLPSNTQNDTLWLSYPLNIGGCIESKKMI